MQIYEMYAIYLTTMLSTTKLSDGNCDRNHIVIISAIERVYESTFVCYWQLLLITPTDITLRIFNLWIIAVHEIFVLKIGNEAFQRIAVSFPQASCYSNNHYNHFN